jgi:uncharacterized membrane protein
MFRHPFVIGGVLLGMGLGGFVDGIVLHQILQWHHLVCITDQCTPLSVEHLQRQTRQDGYFHLGTLVLTVVGSYRVFRAGQRPDVPRSALAFVGPVLCGWGAFNFVEGLINHQFLAIHHVLPGRPYEFAADMAFLASGVGLFGLGWVMVRKTFRPA